MILISKKLDKLEEEKYINSGVRIYSNSDSNSPECKFERKKESLELKLSILQKVHASIKVQLGIMREKKSSNNVNSKISSPASNKLGYNEIKFLDKILLKLNEYPSEFSELVYLIERGSEKIGKQSPSKFSRNKNIGLKQNITILNKSGITNHCKA